MRVNYSFFEEQEQEVRWISFSQNITSSSEEPRLWTLESNEPTITTIEIYILKTMLYPSWLNDIYVYCSLFVREDSTY
jgi:hypothetical protein